MSHVTLTLVSSEQNQILQKFKKLTRENVLGNSQLSILPSTEPVQTSWAWEVHRRNSVSFVEQQGDSKTRRHWI